MSHNRICKTVIIGVVSALAVAGCMSTKNSKDSVTSSPFGQTADGTPVQIYTLRNAGGMEARILTYGGIVQSLKVPDRNGAFGDVVLGYDSLDGYLTNSPYFGSLIGRYGNRIAEGTLLAGWRDPHSGGQQRRQFLARRPQGF